MYWSRQYLSTLQFQKKIILWIPWDMSSCTSEEQVTLHIDHVRIFTSENSNKHFWKSHGISLVPYTHLSYSLSLATWNHLWNSDYFQWVFTYFTLQVTCSPWVFTCENIEFEIHTFLITFKFILIRSYYSDFQLRDNYCEYFWFFVLFVFHVRHRLS